VPRAGRGRATALALAVVVAVTIPFVLWNPHELLRDVVMAQFVQPFRPDGLSWLSAWQRWRGTAPGAWLGFAMAGVGLAIGLRRRPSLATAACTAAAAFLLLVLFNKQAFCNYYWLVVGLLASASTYEPAGSTSDEMAQ
jgi:hypothetical protein